MTTGKITTVRNTLTALFGICALCLTLSMPNALAAETKSANTKEVSTQQTAAKVSINKASVEDLASLYGIGEAKAQAIVAYRKANGAFKSIDQLAEVKGIGEAIINKNRDRLSL